MSNSDKTFGHLQRTLAGFNMEHKNFRLSCLQRKHLGTTYKPLVTDALANDLDTRKVGAVSQDNWLKMMR